MITSILPFALTPLALGYGLAYTPKPSKLRPFLLVLITICCLISVRSTVAASVPAHVANEYITVPSSAWETIPPTERNIKRQESLGPEPISRWTLGRLVYPPFSGKDKTSVPCRRRLFLHRLRDTTWPCGLTSLTQTYRLEPEPEEDSPVPGRTYWASTTGRRESLECDCTCLVTATRPPTALSARLIAWSPA